jgi:hypothetical protein
MDPTKQPERGATRDVTAGGELVVLNGRQSGVRRALAMPVTLVGRDHGCDIRLNVEGVELFHCVLGCRPGEVRIHDLHSERGTFVNGQRVQAVTLRDGDLVDVGPFRFRVLLPPVPPASSVGIVRADAEPDALRIQAAAVAAQQASVDEQEARLAEQHAELDEERRRLRETVEHHAAECQALRQEKAERESVVQQRSDELARARMHMDREHADALKRVDQERAAALAEIEQHRLQVHAELASLRRETEAELQQERVQAQVQLAQQRAETIAQVEHECAAVRAELDEERDRERARADAARDHLSANEQKLAHRMHTLDGVRTELQYEQSALAIQQVHFNTQREIDTRLLQDGWHCLEQDRERWRRRRASEVAVMRARWLFVLEGEPKLAELRRLLVSEQRTWLAQKQLLEDELHGLNRRILNQRQTLQDQEQVRSALTDPEPVTPDPATDARLVARAAELDRVACELADQRAQLVEHWERLARLQHEWEQTRAEIAAELDALTQDLAHRDAALSVREQAVDAAEARRQDSHDQVLRLRRAAALAHARSLAQQEAWQLERAHVLAESNRLSEKARSQLEALDELRRKWNTRRRHETEALRSARHELEALRQHVGEAQRDLARQVQQFEAARRTLADETQALQSGEGPAMSDTLQRRWLSQNAAIVRSLRQQREAFQQELSALDRRQQALALAAEEVALEQSAVAEQQSDLDHRDAEFAAVRARLEQDTRHAENRRMQAEARLAALEAEAEQLARALIPDSESATDALGRAA